MVKKKKIKHKPKIVNAFLYWRRHTGAYGKLNFEVNRFVYDDVGEKGLKAKKMIKTIKKWVKE